MIQELLKKQGLKITEQRINIITAILELDLDATMKNINNKCKAVNESTVYRTIELLLANNIIEKNINQNGEVYYYLKEVHSHYFTCIKCGKKEKLAICPIDNIKLKKGYSIVNHSIMISGICSSCQHN